MKRTVYLLENKSISIGSYVLNGEQKPLYPGETIALYVLPVSVTGNITRSTYVEEVPGGEVTVAYEKSKGSSSKEEK